MAHKQGTERLIVGYAKPIAEALEVIRQYYAQVEGVKPSKAAIFRRAVIVMAQDIKKAKEQSHE